MVDRNTSSNQTKLFLTESSSILYPRTQIQRLGGLLNLSNSQIANSNGRETLAIYPAQTVPSTFLQGASTLQIQIPPTTQFLKHLRIEFTVSNTSGDIVTVLPVPLWFQSLQIQGNNGNIVLQQWTSPPGLFLSQIANIPDEQLMSISGAENINSNDPSLPGPSANIAPGASRKYYLGLEDAFWENVPLWMGDLRGNLILTLNSSPNSILDSGSIAPSSAIILSNCRALATVVYPSQDQISYMARQNIRDNQFLQQSITSQQMSLAANAQYNVRMSGNQGYCPWIWVTTRGPLPFATADLARNWPDITQNLQILDASGNPIVQQVDEQFLSSFMAKDYWQGSQVFTEMGGVTQWSFSNAPSYVQKSGAVFGGYVLTSQEQYVFQTEGNTVSGTYEINIIAPIYSLIRIQDGTFYVYSS